MIQKDENGYFAFVPELKGCVSEGASFEEARANIKEAIKLYLESLETDVIHRIVAKEAEALLLQNGFVVDRQSGSHRIQKRKRMVLPHHSGKILHPKIIKELFEIFGGLTKKHKILARIQAH